MISPDAARAYLILRRIASSRRLTSSNEFTPMSRQMMIDIAREECAKVGLNFAEKEVWYGVTPPPRGDGRAAAPIKKLRLKHRRIQSNSQLRAKSQLTSGPDSPS